MGFAAELRTKPRARIVCMWLNYRDARTGLNGLFVPLTVRESLRYAIGSVPIFRRSGELVGSVRCVRRGGGWKRGMVEMV
jgi:hypothetical protein